MLVPSSFHPGNHTAQLLPAGPAWAPSRLGALMQGPIPGEVARMLQGLDAAVDSRNAAATHFASSAPPAMAAVPRGPDVAAPLDQLLAAWHAAPDRPAFLQSLRDGLARQPGRLAEIERRVQVMAAFRSALDALVATLVAAGTATGPYVAQAARAFASRCLKELYKGSFDMARHWAPEWVLRRSAALAAQAGAAADTAPAAEVQPVRPMRHVRNARHAQDSAPALQVALGRWTPDAVIDYMFHTAHDFYSAGEPFYGVIAQQALQGSRGNPAAQALLKKRLQNAEEYLGSVRDGRARLARDFPQYRGLIDQEASRRLNDAKAYIQRGVPSFSLYGSDLALRGRLEEMQHGVSGAVRRKPAGSRPPTTSAAPALAADVQDMRSFYSAPNPRQILGSDMADAAQGGSRAFDLTQGIYRFPSDQALDGFRNVLKYAVPGVISSYEHPIIGSTLAALDYGVTREGRGAGYNYIQKYFYEHPPRSGRYVAVELRDVQGAQPDQWSTYSRVKGEDWKPSPFPRTVGSIREASGQLSRLTTQAIREFRVETRERLGW